ncbi:hypothetical protein C4F50_07605 [Flavobacterium sp. KB82]|uniref:Uncharacterized protein n=1 Tax=Flavobacterium hungaricum TaxID=2082725 RepID=A0ABR9THH3_9FLAO|nr:hypothetical protein [Flavobacterium hungaricum]
MKDYWQYCKVVNGLFGISLIIWFICNSFPFDKMDAISAVISSLFLFGSLFLVFLSSLIFYLLTKNILTIYEQVRYSLVSLIAILNFFFIVVTKADKSYIVLPLFFTIASLIYIIMNRKIEKSPE